MGNLKNVPCMGGGVNLVEEFPFGSGADQQQDLLSELTQIFFFFFKGLKVFCHVESRLFFLSNSAVRFIWFMLKNV